MSLTLTSLIILNCLDQVRTIYICFCIIADCEDPTCSGHGFCVEGSCVCRKGWRGVSCGQMDHEARQCLPDCSGHGEFDLDTQKCVCRGHWTGSDCSKGMCEFKVN